MKKNLIDFDFLGKRVLLRADFNVPLDELNNITSDNRIVEELPTIKYLISKGAKVIICSHLGRPDGKKNSKYSLKVVANKLSELLDQKVLWNGRTIGKEVKELISKMDNGDVLLLENLRFDPREEDNGEDFSEELASLADVYINDAFGTCHRKHSSTYGVAKLLPAGIGYLIEKELKHIKYVIDEPTRPFIAILGGAKVSDKLPVIENLIQKVDTLLIGGGMAFTFLKAIGGNIGKSIVDDELLTKCKEIISLAKDKGVNLVLPIDVICADRIDKPNKIKKCDSVLIPSNLMGLDIGDKTRKIFTHYILNAGSIILNGPMGVFENKKFAKGTKAIIKAMAKTKGLTVVGGGDSAAAVIKMGFQNKINHISTGGGASLRLLEGKELVGLSVIEDKEI